MEAPQRNLKMVFILTKVGAALADLLNVKSAADVLQFEGLGGFVHALLFRGVSSFAIAWLLFGWLNHRLRLLVEAFRPRGPLLIVDMKNHAIKEKYLRKEGFSDGFIGDSDLLRRLSSS
jgi:hypothetical protein